MLQKLYRSLKTLKRTFSDGQDSSQAFSVSGKLGAELYLAVKSGNISSAEFLISKGANVNYNYRIKPHLSPLFAAYKSNNVAIAKLLIANGAEINLKNENANNWLWVNIFNHKG